MGMFDNVTVEAELPREVKYLPGDLEAGRFQTKDLENLLLHYRITKEGRLMFDDWGQEYEYHNRDGSLYTGELNFYTNGDDGWYQFVARFADGQLIGIVDDTDRIREIWEKAKEELKKGDVE